MDQIRYQTTLIQTALKLQGSSQAMVARDLGVSRVSVHDVVHGRTRSKRIEMRIAAITGRQLVELWPQWYGPKKTRRSVLSREQLNDALRALCG